MKFGFHIEEILLRKRLKCLPTIGEAFEDFLADYAHLDQGLHDLLISEGVYPFDYEDL